MDKKIAELKKVMKELNRLASINALAGSKNFATLKALTELKEEIDQHNRLVKSLDRDRKIDEILNDNDNHRR
jgi:hypothetical protein